MKKLVMLFLAALFMASGVNAQSFDLLDGLEAYYSLSETTGVRYDSHASYDLTAVNNPSSDGSGVSGRALDCNRTSNDYLAINDNSAWGLQGDFTLSFWINIRNTSVDQTIIQKRISVLGAWNEYQIHYDNVAIPPSRLQLLYEQIGGGATTTYNFPIPASPIANKWYHVLIEQDSTLGTITLTVDGQYQTINSVGTNLIGDSVGAVTVCGQYTHSGNFYDGMIDEIGIWHRLLTVQEKNFILSGVGYDEIVEASLPAATPEIPIFTDGLLPNGERLVVQNVVTTGDVILVCTILVFISLWLWSSVMRTTHMLVSKKD